jgi:hypothetical protein
MYLVTAWKFICSHVYSLFGLVLELRVMVHFFQTSATFSTDCLFLIYLGKVHFQCQKVHSLILGLYLAGKIVHEIGVFVVDVWIIGKFLKFTFSIDESAVLYLQDFGEHQAILLLLEYIKVQM